MSGITRRDQQLECALCSLAKKHENDDETMQMRLNPKGTGKKIEPKFIAVSSFNRQFAGYSKDKGTG